MSETSAVITVENVAKKFVFQSGKAGDLREKFAFLRRQNRTAREDFWALKDVSFAVRPGEPVGVVGHNGSGKSTLLKILNGILQPTTGQVRVTGRVGALIEVGAGFHPDLTGRENVYLNGAILGLSRRDIAARFDRIVAFAGLEKFIDTPVKRYSSGMYMRLGFAVAAHTDPEILLIDEVLAVGDAQFQNKCLRFLKEFVKNGGAVLFVSHAMNQVAELCETCVWLDYGQVRSIGPTADTIENYMELVRQREEEEFKRLFPAEWARREAEAHERAESERQSREARDAERMGIRVSLPVRVLRVETCDAGSTPLETLISGETMTVRIVYEAERTISRAVVGIGINRLRDRLVCYGPNTREDKIPLTIAPGIGSIEITFPNLPLLAETYSIDVAILEGDETLYYREEAATFHVTDRLGERGVCRLPHRWQHKPASPQSEPSEPAVAHTAG
jgi:ABC-type polysaccharide/polyol phosphate transport system ATPase subunit